MAEFTALATYLPSTYSNRGLHLGPSITSSRRHAADHVTSKSLDKRRQSAAPQDTQQVGTDGGQHSSA